MNTKQQHQKASSKYLLSPESEKTSNYSKQSEKEVFCCFYCCSVAELNPVLLFATPQTIYSTSGSSVLHYLLEFAQIHVTELVMLFNYLVLCNPLLLFPSIFPTIRVFSNESALCNRWPKYQSFKFSFSPSSEYSVLISFRMNWLDLLAV